MMRRLAKGFERLETRTPPASLFGAIAEFFGQPQEDVLSDLQTHANDELGSDQTIVEDHASLPLPQVSRVDVDPIGSSEDESPLISEKTEKQPIVAERVERVVTDLFPFGSLSNEDIGGTASLIRSSRGVVVIVQPENLDPAAYTTWGVFFNDPGDCEDDCGIDDVQEGRGDVSIAFLDGQVVGDSGEGFFYSRFRENSDGPLKDAAGTEVHVLVRSHGDPIPEFVDIQISTVNGGCTNDTQNPPGPNECGDVAAAVLL